MVCLSLVSKATTYYVSNSGNDTYSGLSTALPWKTLDKVNATTFKAGDQILFKKGDIFYGSLKIKQSGTSANHIVYSTYGTGANPNVTGFISVTAWTNLGNHIWESTDAVSIHATCNMVAINGVNTPMGKYPNENATNMGYKFIQSYSGSTSITNDTLAQQNWIGAEVVIKNSQYQLQRRLIKSQSGGTITWTDAVSDLAAGKPFFVQNSIYTLDQQNEWYYNPTNKKISIYSTNQPVNVNVAAIDTLVTISNSVKYIIVDGITFSGANVNAIYRWPFGSEAERARYFTIRNCSFLFSGQDALSVRIDSLNITNNTISDTNGNGIVADYNRKLIIKDNAISNTSIYKGMQQGWGATSAISLGSAKDALVENNRITNCGYDGINFSNVTTDSITIKYNYVDSFCMVLSDGGGIYGNRNAKIMSNIVLNGGVGMIKLWLYDPWAVGIYLDDNSLNNEVAYNTVYNCNRVGIYLHNSHSNYIHHNTSYHNKTWQIYTQGDMTPNIYKNDTITNNIFISKTGDYQTALYYWGDGSADVIGVLDSNYYCRPYHEGSEINSNSHSYTISQWNTLTGQDAHSKNSPQALTTENDLQFDYNRTNTTKTITLSKPMIDMKGNKYAGSVTLQPFTSVVLMKDNNPASDIPIVEGTQSFEVYPNPCQGEFTVHFAKSPVTGSRIDIFDIAGRKVFSRIITKSYEEFNLSEVVAGLYLVKLIVGSEEKIQKLIIQY